MIFFPHFPSKGVFHDKIELIVLFTLSLCAIYIHYKNDDKIARERTF